MHLNVRPSSSRKYYGENISLEEGNGDHDGMSAKDTQLLYVTSA